MRRAPGSSGARGQAPRPPSNPLRPFSHRLASPRARRERVVHVGCRAVRSEAPCCCASKTTIASAHVRNTNGGSSKTWRGWASKETVREPRPRNACHARASARQPTRRRCDRSRRRGLVYACACSRKQIEQFATDAARRAEVSRHVPRASDCRWAPAPACACGSSLASNASRMPSWARTPRIRPRRQGTC